MAKPHDLIRTASDNNDNNNKPSSSSSSSSSSSNFLCCFGFSQRQPKESIMTVDRKKRNKMSLRLRFSFKTNRRSSVKTVPVLADSEPEREIIKPNYPIPKPKSKSKSTPNDQLPIATVVPTTPDHKKSPSRRNPPHQNNNLDNRKFLAQSNTSIDDTCLKRLSFSRKIDAIRTGSSQPSSPLAAKPVRTMKHSESIPSRPNRIKPSAPAGRVREPAVVRKRFEPLVGMSVVMVTLVIMLMWGRLCAILCTSAWLYFLPRLSTAAVDPDIGRFGSGFGSDLGSEESKKKVVFEGFLERNNYNNNNHTNL